MEQKVEGRVLARDVVGGFGTMKRLILLTSSSLAMALSSCEAPMSRDLETAPPMEAPVAPSAEDAGVAAADTTAPADQPPALDTGRLPPANPSSEESVQPESETLFY
jgi:hypothetical protein